MRAKIENVQRNRARAVQASPEAERGRVVQLRLAKRAQRARDRDNGLTLIQLKLPAAVAERLAYASRQPGFASALAAYLDAEVIEIARFPQLRLLCWNRGDTFLPAAEVFNLYERNWRFVDVNRMAPDERALLTVLAARFGKGVIHA